MSKRDVIYNTRSIQLSHCRHRQTEEQKITWNFDVWFLLYHFLIFYFRPSFLNRSDDGAGWILSTMACDMLHLVCSRSCLMFFIHLFRCLHLLRLSGNRVCNARNGSRSLCILSKYKNMKYASLQTDRHTE